MNNIKQDQDPAPVNIDGAEKEHATGSGPGKSGLAQSLESSQLHPATNVRKVILAGMVTVIIVFGGFGTWASVAQLAGAIIGSGEVKVDLNRKTVQHLEGGIVSEILVRDGDRVKAGQALVVLIDERVSASVDVLQGHLDAELAKSARLEAQRDERDEIIFPGDLTSRKQDPAVAELMDTEKLMFKTKRKALLEEVKLLEDQISEARREIEAMQSQAQSNRSAAALLEEEIAANESLERSQYVQKVHLLTLRRTREDYDGRHAEIRANIARGRQRIAEMEMRIVQIRDRYVQSAVEDLTGVHTTGVYAQIFDLKQRLRPSQDAKRRQRVVAPISGTVVDMQVFTVGGVVRPGQALMDIVPEDNPLIIEAKIQLDDIDSIHVGQAADIRFSAFKRRSTPMVSGTVTYVSADSLTDDATGKTYYLTHVRADDASLEDAGEIVLHPGMPAEVFIKTENRTAIDYLLAPITQTLRRAMRES